MTSFLSAMGARLPGGGLSMIRLPSHCTMAWTLCVLALVGCTGEAPAPAHSLGEPTIIRPGVEQFRTKIGDNQLWAYLPAKRSSKLPCIIIAPAGSGMFHGMKIAKGDRPEHVPYVEAGYAVVCYGVTGPIDDYDDLGVIELYRTINRFMKAELGVADGKAAIDWALENIPGIDPERLYAVGHSSAGTLSLQLAQQDPRIQACVSFMPVVDTHAYHEEKDLFSDFELGAPGYTELTKKLNPATHASLLKCPTLLFSAKDDPRYEDLVAFHEVLKESNPQVSFESVKSGGHYDPMISDGIPAAIRWFKTLEKDAR